MRRFLLLVTVLLCSLSPVEGREPDVETSLIPRVQLLEDFDLLKKTLEEAHPRYDHYTQIDVLEQAFSDARAQIDRSLTALQFYRIAVKPVAAIGDGHTQLKIPEPNENSHPPFEAYVVGSSLWVSARYNDAVPPVGSEILSINGKKTDGVLKTLRAGISRDWNLESGRRAEISNNFPYLYTELVDSSETYLLDYFHDGEEKSATVPSITRSELDQARHTENLMSPISWKALDNNVVYIDLNSFNDGNFEIAGQDFRTSFDAAMNFVKEEQPNSIILDMRQNGGGESSNGAYAAARFLSEPFDYLRSVTSRVNVLPAVEHSQWASSAESAQMEFNSVLKIREDGRFDVTADWYQVGQVSPHSWVFDGRLYVITDGLVASTGSDFVAILDHQNRATFIGEMVGGSFDGNASGLTARITLPASGLMLNLPLFDFQLATDLRPQEAGAVPPDLEIIPTITDLTTNTDSVLAGAVLLSEMETKIGKDFAQKLTRYFETLAVNKDFQGVVLVSSVDGPAYRRPFGYADISSERLHSLNSRFGIASVTKTFTAGAILRLRDQGFLNLDDPVSRFIPEFPNGEAITIGNLLRHESGLGEIPVSMKPRNEIPGSQALVKMIALEPPAFAPGSDSRYSNSGFTLLARIIEIASGKQFHTYLRKTFFEPLEMDNTGDRREPDAESNIVTPNFPGPPPIHLDRLPLGLAWDALGSGSLYSTADDLGRWGHAVAEQRFFNLESEKWPYGWGKTEVAGNNGLIQTGLTDGFNSSIQVFPGEKLVIVILSNVEHGAWVDWANDAARMVFGEDATLKPTSSDAVIFPMTEKIAAPFEGRFQLNEERFVDISFEDGHLWLRLNAHPRRHYMVPTGPSTFTFRSFSGDISFELPDKGEISPGFNWKLPASWNQPDELYLRISENE